MTKQTYSRESLVNFSKREDNVQQTLMSDDLYNTTFSVKELDENIAYSEDTHDHFDEYIEKFKEFLDEEEIDLIVYHLLYGFTFKDLAIMKNVTTDVISSKYRRTLIKIRKNYKKGWEYEFKEDN